MSTCKCNTNTKLSDLCDDLEGCKLGKISDEELFKQPTPYQEDCPICFLTMPSIRTGFKYMSCCGKMICSGCYYAPVYDNQGNKVTKVCPFCRTPVPTSEEEAIERTKKRVEVEDPLAIYNHGNYYRDGKNGFPQDMDKAFELWHRSAELGFAKAYGSIGFSYAHGRGIEVDENKAAYYYELAAVGGDAHARRNLGLNEALEGNVDRAVKHFMIAIKNGDSKSMEIIKKLYSEKIIEELCSEGAEGGYVTKDDYTKALRLYQEYLGEIKSKQRDKAAAFNSEKYRYH